MRDPSTGRDHCNPILVFGGEYKCLRFLTPDVTIEWEKKRNLKVAQKRALESLIAILLERAQDWTLDETLGKAPEKERALESEH